MGDDFTTHLRQVAGLKEGCDPSTANILLGCAEYIERLQRRDMFDDGTITHIARQARTIRRLRALADGYRANAAIHRAHCVALLEPAQTERACIVAALRKLRADHHGAGFHVLAAGVSFAADAIELGEL
jgi:hypothetical protein